jgi:hypothetical protein
MAQIGVDCEIILDNQGYFIVPESYIIKQPRISKSAYRADGTLSYVDLGPGKREFLMTVLAKPSLLNYDGTANSNTGQQFRDALRSSYTSNIAATIVFKDPTNTSINVYFAHYQERILDLKSQIIALSTGGSLAGSYECAIELLEA